MPHAQAQSTERDASPALGARENFFDPDDDNYTDEETLTGPRDTDVGRDWGVRHTFTSGTSKIESVAHDILRENGTATFFCPVCLFEGDDTLGIPEDTASEQTDPTVHVPKEFPEQFAPKESGQYRFRRRYCDHAAHVAFGGKLANRSTEEFMAKVDEVLDFVVEREENSLAREKADGIRSGAFDMKIDGEMDDEEIMQEVVADVLDALGGE